MSIKTFLAAACAVTLISAAPVMASQLSHYTAYLDGSQQVPANESKATGKAKLTVNSHDQTLSFRLSVMGIHTSDLYDTLVSSLLGPLHLHEAAVGLNGAISIPFAFNTTDYVDTEKGFELRVKNYAYSDALSLLGSTQSFTDFVAGLNEGGVYVNVHTDAYTGGEIRGQLAPVPLPASALLLVGAMGGLVAFRRKRRAALAV